MATLSRVAMNNARHKQGKYAEQSRIAGEKRKEEREKEKAISKEEHEERIRKLKEMGLIKENGNKN